MLQVNYEFYDNQTVETAQDLVDALQRGERPHPTRGAAAHRLPTVELEIAGIFPDLAGRVEGPSAATETLRGVRLAARPRLGRTRHARQPPARRCRRRNDA